eukprot:TRINITY_DN906_c0_g1_i2.p1 TRINITY_DN906_c0_g1~~TRINITY_DN906_c0_g1_i2.p1  ORF type:complete len:274 (+),score=14.64 TRINITY_DN906_c0_g1_i2:76-897(+)
MVKTGLAHTVKTSVPVVVSQIIDKLLNKIPSERYQSAHGLCRDLDKCLQLVTDDGHIEQFEIGSFDVPILFNIAPKLYGRDRELVQLQQILERVVAGSRNEMVTVSGYSGVGKTSIIRRLCEITRRPVHFACGKFDQYSRSMPYSAIVEALSQRAKSVLTLDSDSIKMWKKTLLKHPGDNLICRVFSTLASKLHAACWSCTQTVLSTATSSPRTLWSTQTTMSFESSTFRTRPSFPMPARLGERWRTCLLSSWALEEAKAGSQITEVTSTRSD